MIDEIITFSPKNLNNIGGIESFYGELLSLLERQQVQNLQLDLSGLSFLNPEAIIVLITAARIWHKQRATPLNLILNPQTQHYFEQLNLFDVAQTFLNVSNPVPSKQFTHSQNKSRTQLEILPISSEERQNAFDLYRVSGRLRAILTTWLLDKIDPVTTVVHEVIENITHSGDTGYILVQKYKGYSADESRIHIAIGDLGIGIQASLKTKYPQLGEGSVYLRQALEPGMSSRAQSGGLGLSNVRKLVADGQGTLTLRSFSSMIQIANSEVYSWDNLPNIAGTQIFINIWGRHYDWQRLLPTP